MLCEEGLEGLVTSPHRGLLYPHANSKGEEPQGDFAEVLPQGGGLK